jgi:hypothetical protein
MQRHADLLRSSPALGFIGRPASGVTTKNSMPPTAWIDGT